MRFQTNDIFSCPLDPQTLGSVDFTYAILDAWTHTDIRKIALETTSFKIPS